MSEPSRFPTPFRPAVTFAAALALIALPLAGCPSNDAADDAATAGAPAAAPDGGAEKAKAKGGKTLKRLKKAGSAKVGFANEAPYAYKDNESGRLTGEAPEVARVILERLGVPKVKGVLTEFGSLIPSLKAKRVDLIAAGMYVTPARCEQVIFSEPTYCIGEAMVVPAGNPLELNSYEDVKNHESAKLGVVSGTVEVGYAKAVGIPKDRIVKFPDAPSAMAGVKAGRADAYAGTELTVRDLLTKLDDPELAQADPFTNPIIDGKPTRGCGAFAFRPKDEALRDAFNAELAGFLGSPEHLELVEPFGFGAAQIPGTDVTTKALCTP